MGQIFNRFKEYLKSEISFNETEIPNQDEELKKIIDDLNKPPKEENNNYQSSHEQDPATSASTNMDLKRACTILEIPLDADLETIQNSYRKMIKEYHPDKVHNLGKEIRLLAEKKTIEINQAYEYIKTIKNIK